MKRLITSAAMFLCCMSTTFAQFSGLGEGTKYNPYQITNAIQLNEVRNHLDKAFILMNDIDLTAYLEDEYPYFGWLPIGTFTGSFNGNNKTISGLWTNRSSDYIGLFSICQSATIMNLTLKDVNIKGNGKVGAICGYMEKNSNSITNCNISGKIEGNTYVGGCIGQYYGGSGNLSQITSSANVIGTGLVGGLIGKIDNGSGMTISSCIVQSSISGIDSEEDYYGFRVGGDGSSVGGIVGSFYGSQSVNITGCGFRGSVNGNSCVGGIAGNYAGNADNCFSIATITAEGDYSGGLFGSLKGGAINNCFSRGSVTGNKCTGGLIGFSNVESGSIRMYYCYFDGEVKGTTQVGGLFGGSGEEGHVSSGIIAHNNVSIAKSISAKDEYGRVFGYHANDYYVSGNKAYNRMKIIVNGHEMDLSTVTENPQNGTGVGETTLKQIGTYSSMGWDFTNVWAIKESEGFPYLKIAEDDIVGIQVDGLYYYLDNVNNQAQVTSMPYGEYTGNIVIPLTFNYQEKTYSVTSIGVDAFYGCEGLTSVTIPNSVTSINGGAFKGCSGLTSVTLNSNSIVSKAYSNDYSLIHIFGNQVTKYIIGDDVTSIGGYAFQYCSKLTSITIPNSVTKIGERAFSSCSGLTSVTIPNSVTSIGDFTFSSCSGLTSVTIPNSVKSIGYGAFDYCINLTSVTIPNSVTSIDTYAFAECYGLISVEIPNSVTSIGNGVFYDCSKLTSVTIKWPEPISIRSDVFPNRANATLYVPVGSKAKYEAANYWKEFKKIVEIAEPTNITFADANVKTICVAHWDTDGNGELSYDEAAAVTTISNYFSGNTSITSFDELQYFTGLTSIGEDAFWGCSGLTSVTIPNSVTSIEKNAFYGCYFKKQDFINNSSLDAEANNYWGAAIVDSRENGFMIKDGTLITYIGNEASVTIPNSVTSIGESAFEGCEDLTSITIPNSVMNIGSLAFGWCPSLTKVIVSDIAAWCRISFADPFSNPLNYAQHLYSDENTEIKDLVIPNSVTSIGNYAFTGCSGLTSFTIPNSVTSIGKYAFSECSKLTSITIPHSVTTIGEEAFSMCPGLTSVICEATEVPSTGNRVFSDVTQSNATLYVPYSALEDYKTTTPWSEFGSIVALPEPTIRGDVNGDGEVNVGDLVSVSNYMAGDESVSKDAADVNEDGEVNVGDMVVISNIMSGNE